MSTKIAKKLTIIDDRNNYHFVILAPRGEIFQASLNTREACKIAEVWLEGRGMRCYPGYCVYEENVTVKSSEQHEQHERMVEAIRKYWGFEPSFHAAQDGKWVAKYNDEFYIIGSGMHSWHWGSDSEGIISDDPRHIEVAAENCMTAATNDSGGLGRYPSEDEDMWNAEETRP